MVKRKVRDMKFDKETVIRWRAMVSDYANELNISIQDIKTGSEAWAIAHKVGITKEAYEDRSVVDAHIKTVLQSIFPQATFLDKYSY